MLTSFLLIATAIILVSAKLIKNVVIKYKLKNSKLVQNKENLQCQACGLEFHKDKFLAHVLDTATFDEMEIKESPLINLLSLNKHKYYIGKAIAETQKAGGNLQAISD